MKEQDIADFENAIHKVCEDFREKLTHATLVGVLDTVKTSYHISSIQYLVPTNESPTPNEM